MKRQKKQVQIDPDLIIKETRIQILALVNGAGLIITPNDFELAPSEDTEYPKMVKVDNAGRIDSLRVNSREEEEGLDNIWKDPAEKARRGRPKGVTNGDSQDGSTGDK